AAAVRLALPGEVERREVAFTAWGWRERVAGAGFELRLAVATVATARFRLEAELPQGGAPTVVVSPPALSLARVSPPGGPGLARVERSGPGWSVRAGRLRTAVVPVEPAASTWVAARRGRAAALTPDPGGGFAVELACAPLGRLPAGGPPATVDAVAAEWARFLDGLPPAHTADPAQ